MILIAASIELNNASIPVNRRFLGPGLSYVAQSRVRTLELNRLDSFNPYFLSELQKAVGQIV